MRFGTAICRAVLVLALLGVGRMVTAAEATTSSATTQAVAAKKIALKDFELMREKDDAVVLDVRTPREFAAGHVPGAVNIDWHARDFADQVAKLDKSKKYLVHCQGGVRSAAAVKRMGTMGFGELFDYSGGFLDYSKAGKPIEK